MNYIINLFKTNTIAKISLCISILTFIFSYNSNRFKIKVKLLKFQNYYGIIDENGFYNLSLECQIQNKSKFPITITNAKLNNYEVFPLKVPIRGSEIQKMNHDIDFAVFSFEIPLKLETYEALNGSLFFSNNNPIILRKINLLRLYTTRGIYFKLLIKPKKTNQ